MKSIETVRRQGMCSGCGLCQSYFGESKVKLRLNKNGYLTPNILKAYTKKDDKQFKVLCPSINFTLSAETNGSNKYDPIIGHYVSLMTGWSSESDIRKNSSSGGALSSLLIYLLEQKVVDGIIHIGGSSIDPYKCDVYVSKTKEEILSNSGSRYIQSAPLINIDNIIKKGNKYAFVGRPCDIHALTLYAKEKDSVKDSIIIKIAFLCGGAPSIMGTYNAISELNVNTNNVSRILYRGNGWPGKFRVYTKDGDIREMSYDDSWGKYLGPTSPLICKICFDGVGEYADIVFGDAWHCDERGYPDFNENEGRNLIIARTFIGDEFLRDCISQQYIIIEQEDLNPGQFYRMQPSQTQRRNMAFEKILGLRLCFMQYPKVNIKRIKKMKIRYLGIYKSFRTIVGTMKRVILCKK